MQNTCSVHPAPANTLELTAVSPCTVACCLLSPPQSQPCFSCARCLTDVPHNVWLQLLRCCVKCDECWPLLLPLAIIYGNQLSALKQQRQDVQRKVQSLCAGASSGSSGNNCMVETQLRVAELLQEARRLVLVVEDLKTALKMVLNAYEGTTDSSSECEV